MRTPSYKVYGFLKPCSNELVGKLQISLAMMGEEAGEALSLTGQLLNIGYEGAYFPVEDFLQALKAQLELTSEGKLDYIDMEKWTLTRYIFKDGLINAASRNLNDVLAYSGH